MSKWIENVRRWAASWGAFGAVVCGGGIAQADSHLVGSDYISRPLVLPKGVLRIDGGPDRPYSGGQVMPGGELQVQVRPGDDAAYFVPGAAYGVLDGLELGAVWPLQLSPNLDLLDVSAYGKYSLQRGEVEVAAYAEVRVPIQDDFQIAGGVPVYVHIGPTVRLDTGGFVRINFGNDTTVNVDVPLSVPIQISPQIFVGPELGVEIVDFKTVAVPLGAIAGYTLGTGISSIGDLFARLNFADVTHGADVVRFDVGVQLYFDL